MLTRKISQNKNLKILKEIKLSNDLDEYRNTWKSFIRQSPPNANVENIH